MGVPQLVRDARLPGRPGLVLEAEISAANRAACGVVRVTDVARVGDGTAEVCLERSRRAAAHLDVEGERHAVGAAGPGEDRDVCACGQTASEDTGQPRRERPGLERFVLHGRAEVGRRHRVGVVADVVVLDQRLELEVRPTCLGCSHLGGTVRQAHGEDMRGAARGARDGAGWVRVRAQCRCGRLCRARHQTTQQQRCGQAADNHSSHSQNPFPSCLRLNTNCAKGGDPNAGYLYHKPCQGNKKVICSFLHAGSSGRHGNSGKQGENQPHMVKHCPF